MSKASEQKVIPPSPVKGVPCQLTRPSSEGGPTARGTITMISAPQSDIVKRRLKGKVRIGNGGTAQGTSALGAMPWPHRRAPGRGGGGE